MAEALWYQVGSVDYTAEEDRRGLAAIATAGVSTGLEISAGAGLSVDVTAGDAFVDDGANGRGIAYFDSTTNVSLAGSATSTIYVTIDPTTALATMTAGAAPADPYLAIGTATTDASSVTSVSNVRDEAVPPALDGRVLFLSGGTMTGALTVPTLTVTGALTAGSSGLSAPDGIKLGGASNPTKRHWIRGKAAGGSTQQTTNGNWTRVKLETVNNELTDYGSIQYGWLRTGNRAGQFVAPVTGLYNISGAIMFEKNNTGSRVSRVVVRDGDDVVYTRYCANLDPNEAGDDLIWVEATMRMAAGQSMEMQAVQYSGGKLNIIEGSTYSGGRHTHAAFSLLQAF